MEYHTIYFSIYHSNDIFEVCFIAILASFSEVCARLAYQLEPWLSAG